MARGNHKTVEEKCGQVKEFIVAFQEKNGYSPSFAEIMQATGIKTRSHVHYILNLLSGEGLIDRKKGIARGIRLPQSDKDNLLSVRLLGQIAASSQNPLIVLDEYDPLSCVEVPSTMIPTGTDISQIYALQVQGNSMSEAMIADGDIVIMQHGNAWNSGDKVAVWLDKDQGVTLKEIRPGRDGVVKLKPKSHLHPTRVEDGADIRVQGRVLAVLRKCW
jgi:repressor LexA